MIQRSIGESRWLWVATKKAVGYSTLMEIMLTLDKPIVLLFNILVVLLLLFSFFFRVELLT